MGGCHSALQDTARHHAGAAKPRRFHVKVQQGDRSARGVDQCIGLKVVVKSNGLTVMKVNDGGIIAEWNREHPRCQVRPGDLIASVNDKSENMTEMLSELHNASTLDIGFVGSQEPACSRPWAPNVAARATKLDHPEDVVQLPLVCPGQVSDGEVTCAICITELPAEARVLQLPCGHMFHLECAAMWLKRKCACPLCKRTVRRGPLGDEDIDPELLDEGLRPRAMPRIKPANSFKRQVTEGDSTPSVTAEIQQVASREIFVGTEVDVHEGEQQRLK